MNTSEQFEALRNAFESELVETIEYHPTIKTFRITDRVLGPWWTLVVWIKLQDEGDGWSIEPLHWHNRQQRAKLYEVKCVDAFAAAVEIALSEYRRLTDTQPVD
jgi:hypothetical protein